MLFKKPIAFFLFLFVLNVFAEETVKKERIQEDLGISGYPIVHPIQEDSGYTFNHSIPFIQEETGYTFNYSIPFIQEDIPLQFAMDKEILQLNEDLGILTSAMGSSESANITEVITEHEEFSNIKVVPFTRIWAIKQRIIEMYQNKEDPSEMITVYYDLLASSILSEEEEN